MITDLLIFCIKIFSFKRQVKRIRFWLRTKNILHSEKRTVVLKTKIVYTFLIKYKSKESC